MRQRRRTPLCDTKIRSIIWFPTPFPRSPAPKNPPASLAPSLLCAAGILPTTTKARQAGQVSLPEEVSVMNYRRSPPMMAPPCKNTTPPPNKQNTSTKKTRDQRQKNTPPTKDKPLFRLNHPPSAYFKGWARNPPSPPPIEFHRLG